MSQWVGYAVSLRCGSPLGAYQGTVAAADGDSLTLTKVFRNGFPYPEAQVTLNASDIKSLSIIDRPEPAAPRSSTKSEGRGRKKQPRATVCESLQASHHQTQPPQRNVADGGGSTRVPAAEIEAAPARNKGHANNTGCSRGGGGGGGLRRRDEAAFGVQCELTQGEFDFEGNLALFDREALRRSAAARPDLLPATAYRHDQNVLRSVPPPPPIAIPESMQGAHSYVTDSGAVVPSASPELRERLWTAMERQGLLDGAVLLLGRAAADVSLRLLGGGRRLEPRNAHQAPTVAALGAAGRAGRAALAAGRLLSSHGVNVVCCTDRSPSLGAEVVALTLSGIAVVHSPSQLPTAGLDAVLLGLGGADEPSSLAMLRWASSARAALLAIEPPVSGWESLPLRPRAALLGLLPSALPPTLGRLYLANVSPPAPLLSAHGVTYAPPFGASCLLPLHRSDDDPQP